VQSFWFSVVFLARDVVSAELNLDHDYVVNNDVEEAGFPR
jgi:hypothetical protein